MSACWLVCLFAIVILLHRHYSSATDTTTSTGVGRGALQDAGVAARAMGDVEDRAEQPYAASSAGLVSDSVQVEPCVGVEGSGLPTTTETTPQTPIPSVRTRSSSSRAQIGFPPIRLDINAPVGSYLNPHTSSTEGGRSYISRSGYAQLARSSAFVTGLSDDIDVLLDTWSKEWLSLTAQPATDASHKEPIGDGEAHSNGLGSAHIQAKHAGPSPFQLFVEVYQRLGWHNAQMTWSEHEPTRAAMYETCIRSFTGTSQTSLARGQI